MKSFKEYLEEKEYKELNEGVVDTVLGAIGKILGIGTAGVLSAWLAALIFKGGVGAVNSFSSTMGESKALFKKNLKETVKESPAVKKEINEMDKLKNKYEEELSEVVNPLRDKKFDEAAEAFKNLPREKQVSTEVKRFLVEEIVKATEQLPISQPTPGNKCYQVIKSFYDLATAKTIANSLQEEAKKYIIEKE